MPFGILGYILGVILCLGLIPLSIKVMQNPSHINRGHLVSTGIMSLVPVFNLIVPAICLIGITVFLMLDESPWDWFSEPAFKKKEDE